MISKKTINSSKGVTMTELLICISLISILTVIGFSCFDTVFKVQKAKDGSDIVISAIRQAKHYARANGIITSVNLLAGNEDFGFKADGVYIQNSANFDASSGKLPENIKIISNACGEIFFNPAGNFTDADGNFVNQDCNINVGYTDGPFNTITVRARNGNVAYAEQ